MFYSKEVDGGNFKCQVQSLPPPKSPMKTYVLLARSLAASPNTPTLIPEHCGYRGDLTGGRGWGCQRGNSSLRPLADILSIARGHQDLQAEGRGRRMSRGQRARLRRNRGVLSHVPRNTEQTSCSSCPHHSKVRAGKRWGRAPSTKPNILVEYSSVPRAHTLTGLRPLQDRRTEQAERLQ